MCLPPISVARSSRLQLLSLKPGSHSMRPSSRPSHHACQPPDVLPTPDLTATVALVPDSCHGLLAGLPASPSPSRVALLKPKSDQATWLPFLTGQGGLVTEASVASRCPPRLTSFLWHSRAFLLFPQHPPRAPTPGSPTARPLTSLTSLLRKAHPTTPYSSSGWVFCHSTCHFLPYYIIYPLICLFSFVLALHYNVYRDF